ncbi:hypothetical protein [Olsenella phocaeensis]|uniref:hypothetical protein n=1 Tax=Olsenella phocaeensis TaxID=1852385 RepID=UPI001356642C|nr:hypothetical protein [Olsenella phocaeensis]
MSDRSHAWTCAGLTESSCASAHLGATWLRHADSNCTSELLAMRPSVTRLSAHGTHHVS